MDLDTAAVYMKDYLPEGKITLQRNLKLLSQFRGVILQSILKLPFLVLDVERDQCLLAFSASPKEVCQLLLPRYHHHTSCFWSLR